LRRAPQNVQDRGVRTPFVCLVICPLLAACDTVPPVGHDIGEHRFDEVQVHRE
jgi:predicted small secreted protein